MSSKQYLIFFLLYPLIASCGREEEQTTLSVVADHPTDDLSVSVEEVTGAHTRAVWAKHQNPDGSDTFVNGESHLLMGFDSRDGLGTRTLVDQKGNFARPLLSPDGEYVVFTDKQVERDGKGRKKYDPVVRLLRFGDSESYTLAKGYAAEVWRDPATKIDWVYAVRDLKTSDQGPIEAKTLVRFQLLKPYEEELVWNRAAVCPDNIQFSRDGTRACSQFPWPVGGYLDLVKNDWVKLGHGCWTSYSPDDSHIAWVFDGPHRGVAMFATKTGQRWKLDLGGAPGTESHELYHPRWSNDPRLITLTGPYKGVEGRDIQVTKGGSHAEVYIGRLNPELTGVEAWAALTDDELGDFYPDVWVAGGDQRSLDLNSIAQKGSQAGHHTTVVNVASSGWPVAEPSGIPLFQWENRASKNEIKFADGSSRVCSLQLHGLARFGRFQQARLRGGWAVPDGPSLGSMIQAQSQRLGIEFVLRSEAQTGAGGSVVQLRRWHLVREGADMKLWDLAMRREAKLGAFPANVDCHLALMVGDDGFAWAWWNGEPVELAWNPRGMDGRGMEAIMFGDSSDISIESVSAVQLPQQHVWNNDSVRTSASSALEKIMDRPAVERLRIRAKLVATTPIPSYETIKPYTRALVSYAYEEIEVLDGSLEANRVVVQKWGLMDKQIVPGMPMKVGQIQELVLEPLAAHTELEGERSEDDILDFSSPTFYDIGP